MLAWMIFGEAFAPWQAAGFVMLLAGIYLAAIGEAPTLKIDWSAMMVKRLRGMVLLWLFVASFGVSAVEIVAAEFGVFDASDPKRVVFEQTQVIPHREGQRYGWMIEFARREAFGQCAQVSAARQSHVGVPWPRPMGHAW